MKSKVVTLKKKNTFKCSSADKVNDLRAVRKYLSERIY